jgi:ubiquinone/menaquinone biosynthesis C-methylase UbiE
VGCGEATTLSGVLKHLNILPEKVFGFDISWSRCAHGIEWLTENYVSANLFVSDLFEIPIEDSSIDIVYTSHSLEPNGGREEAAIRELLRVARDLVVLVEPLYELANSEAQSRMQKHGYVRNLKKTAELLGASVIDYRLLDYCGNSLNPSGLVIMAKNKKNEIKDSKTFWRCPVTHSKLTASNQGYYSQSTGIAYPVLGGIPLLRSCHAIVASSFERFIQKI